MAADSGSHGPTILLALVALVTGYVAWQVGPLSRRMDALDRDRLETNDRLQREIETLRDQLDRVRFLGTSSPTASARPPVREPAPQNAAAAPAAAVPPAVPAAAPTKVPAQVSITNAETYFNRRLLPEDAAIATLFVESIPVPEIARRLKHSTAFIVAKGIQIEKQLSNAPDAPPEVAAALRAAVERAKAQR